MASRGGGRHPAEGGQVSDSPRSDFEVDVRHIVGFRVVTAVKGYASAQRVEKNHVSFEMNHSSVISNDRLDKRGSRFLVTHSMEGS